jgi:hypothetical protein
MLSIMITSCLWIYVGWFGIAGTKKMWQRYQNKIEFKDILVFVLKHWAIFYSVQAMNYAIIAYAW